MLTQAGGAEYNQGCMIGKLVKTVSVLLAVVVFAAVIAACADSGGSTGQTPEPAPAVPPPPEQGDTETAEKYVCNCTEPEGILAPYDAAAPDAFNTKTPKDTFVAGAGAMNGEFVYGWGSNTYDHSIKVLTGGYKDTYWITPDGQIKLNGSVICNVAAQYDERWNKTYTFTLHNYLKWSDGTSLTAADYVAGILMYASPAFAAAGGESSIGEGIKGYEAYSSGAEGGPSAAFEGISLIDELTFSATIDAKELPYFWETSLVTFKPVYKSGWFPENTIISGENGARFAKDISEDLERIAATERFAPTVTCGPYKFVSFDGGSVSLERNEHFGVCPEGYVPYFDKIVQIEAAGKAGIDMLRSGEADFMAGVDRDEAVAALETEPEPAQPADVPAPAPEPAPPPVFVKLNKYHRAGFGFLEFSLSYGPTQEHNVRRAIAYIINRSMIIENALADEAVTVDAAYSPAQWAAIARRGELAKELPPFFHSIEDANSLLDKTAWRYEADGTTVFDEQKASGEGTYLRHNSSGEALRIVAASASHGIGEALGEAAAECAAYSGMEFIVEQTDAKTLLDHYYNAKTFSPGARKWHAFQLAADFPPVDDKYWSYHSALADEYTNTNGVRDGKLDEITMAMRSLDPSQTDEYADLWLEFQMRWQQVLPAFPLYCNLHYDGYNNIVTQVPTSAYAGYHDIITHIAKHG